MTVLIVMMMMMLIVLMTMMMLIVMMMIMMIWLMMIKFHRIFFNTVGALVNKIPTTLIGNTPDISYAKFNQTVNGMHI